MASFANLKYSRAQKDAKRSVIRPNVKPTVLDQSGHELKDEVVSVDSSEASKVSVDQPQQPENQHEKTNTLPHSSLPPGLEVRLKGSKGRGIWNCDSRHKGQILLSETQIVAALSTRYLPVHCSACFLGATDKPLKRCFACRVIYYCDSECQTHDWMLHKREYTVVASDAIRALGRLFWRRQKKGPENDWVKNLNAMQSHRGSFSSNELTSQLHTHMIHALVRYLGAESIDDLSAYGIDSITSLVDIVSQFTTNAFAVTSPSLTPIGVCLSPTVALFNHSCEPNAVLVFPRAQHRSKTTEPTVEVIAIQDIAADEEVVISYIDSTLPRHERQQALKETYHFTCDCLLCSQPREERYVDPREGMYCPKKCEGSCWLPTKENPLTRCTKCGALVKDTDSVLDAIRIGQEAVEKATRVQFSDPPKAIQLTTNLIPILTSAGLLPSSHPLLALSRLHTTLLISNFRSPFETKHLDDAIRSATRTCNVLNQLLPYGHPIRGVAVAELGKLLSVDESAPKHLVEGNSSVTSPTPHTPSTSTTTPISTLPFTKAAPYPPSGPQRLKLAYETLLRARAELMVGFGGGKNEGGQVGMEVRNLLVDVEKELGVWREGIRSAMADLPRPTR
ncbi:Histone-lysine N-methyltransferase ASHR1 [Leucoagaricus sp. SymC.cos]|nr:Histone-lysine N-methyltransferase ASHR1 [Leucoagaricus sp. SymC.cos]